MTLSADVVSILQSLGVHRDRIGTVSARCTRRWTGETVEAENAVLRH